MPCATFSRPHIAGTSPNYDVRKCGLDEPMALVEAAGTLDQRPAPSDELHGPHLARRAGGKPRLSSDESSSRRLFVAFSPTAAGYAGKDEI